MQPPVAAATSLGRDSPPGPRFANPLLFLTAMGAVCTAWGLHRMRGFLLR
ncbi:hypothetical protein POF50_031120 [Streptomyces sp. SL13]|uniref:Uncharacterized protein n=1 Tax=Streptantibioticus silvisoli TaxID=2705255 RepID=A0AA90KIV4_9ACTN|nr:hypothetical protein [Streptantibioticus silvisoli]MDI5973740.1 hypothetical protein [Streptantibioticus silvisoli]